MSDELLFKKIKKGDEGAFEKLFRRYYKPLMRFIWGYVKSEAIAEELVQELFARIWEKRTALTIRSSIKSYLYSAGRNMSLDYLKHQEVVQEWANEKKALHMDKPHDTKIDKTLHNKMLLEEVEKAIISLPERRRLIFILSRYEDMTYKEIAEFLEISVNTVETQMGRALATLRERFSSLWTFLIGLSVLIS